MLQEEDPIDFGDLARQEKRVLVGGALHVVREADEDAACKHKNAAAKEVVLGPDGKPTGLRNVADTDPYLLSLCLFEVTSAGERPVPVKTIRSWPSRVTRPLIALAKRISRMEDEETAEALERRIAEDTEKLKKLRNGHQEEREKNS